MQLNSSLSFLSKQHKTREEDKENAGYNFTDGCGGIGVDLARTVYGSLPGSERVSEPDGESRGNSIRPRVLLIQVTDIISDYLPSAYQFRLQGCKGVVTIDPQLEPRTVLIRPSMVKFKSSSFPKFAVCGVSRPYIYGHLNRQLIYLLSALGVPDDNFLALQREYFDLAARFRPVTDP